MWCEAWDALVRVPLTTRKCRKNEERAPRRSALTHLFSVAGSVCVSLGHCFFCRKVTFPDQRISSCPRSWCPLGSALCLFSSSSSLKQPFPFLLFFSSFNDVKPLSPAAAIVIAPQQHRHRHPQKQQWYCCSYDCFWYQSIWWPLSTVSKRNDWFELMPEGRQWRSQSSEWFQDGSVWLTVGRRASWAKSFMCSHSSKVFVLNEY